MRILVVEDERKVASFISQGLAEEGHAVEVAADGAEALDLVLAGPPYDLVVLDLMLPKRDGFGVLKSLGDRGVATPVLVLTARDSVADKVAGFDLGADDYLVKPFDSGELLARVTSLLRRFGKAGTSILQADDLTMDVGHRTVKRGPRVISLSPKEFALLEFFLRNKNQILTRKRIAEQVWGYAFETQTNIVDVYVSYLRNAIDKGARKKLIHTIHREGFILSE